MFKVNRRTDYAIRVLLYLAQRPVGSRASAEEVMREMLVPRAYLHRIIATLSNKGFLATFAGPKGGFELALPAQEINLLQIWEAMEAPLIISDCLKAPRACPLDEGCPVRQRWGRIQALLVHELKSITLADLALEAQGAPVAHSMAQTEKAYVP